MSSTLRVRYRAPTEERLTAADRLRTALELADLAEEMVRARLRREHPDASDDEIEALVDSWYGTRPGAKHGDGEGVPGTWPRHHAP
jgi:hypothetical protein